VFVHLALAFLCFRRKAAIHWLTMALLADFGAMCAAGGISVYYRYEGFFVNLAVFAPMVLLSPIGAAFALECLSPRGVASPILRVLLPLTAAVFAVGLAFVALGVGWKAAYVLSYDWLFLTFLVIAVIEGIELRPIRKMPRPLYLFYLIVCGNVCLILAMAACRTLDFFPGLYVLWMLQIASILSITFLTLHAPETFRLIRAAARTIRCERSSLSPEVVGATVGRLGALMEDERLYLNSELSLDDLARRVSLSTHQLSELINIHLGNNFASYVNSFRIERAKELLSGSPEMTVIEVAYGSGFNSKSAFNATFRNLTGKTPTEYRAELGRVKEPCL
jgi:AraC-like DNA-binding protein